jgi:hypothetical protein
MWVELVCCLASVLAVVPVVTTAPATRWWIESSLTRVMPASTPTAAREAKIALAGNEHESFQVALRAQANTSYT